MGVRDSSRTPALMVNDFVVGTVGASETDPSDEGARRLAGFLPRKPKQVYYKNKKSKRRGRK